MTKYWDQARRKSFTERVTMVHMGCRLIIACAVLAISATTFSKCVVAQSAIDLPIGSAATSGYLDPYRQRAQDLNDKLPKPIQWNEMIESQSPDQIVDDGTLSVDGSPAAISFDQWWDEAVSRPIGLSPESILIDVGGLTEVALVSSPRIQSLLATPQIRYSDVIVADAEFDSTVFLEGKYTDTNDPVGSTLTVGDNSTRFRDETFTSAMGLRRKNRVGGQFDITQRGGYQQNNSLFLIPNPQGTTRLEINYTHPLRRDSGRCVNQTRIVLAQLDYQRAQSDTRLDLEQHLFQVTQAYWSLYQARVEWLQQKKLIDSAENLHQILLARQMVDSHQRQILRARSALMSRKSEIAKIEARVRDAQAQLRLLTGSVELRQASSMEWIPRERPTAIEPQSSFRQNVITGLENRADITEAIQKIHSVSTRVGAAKNQVLPRLDLILGTYVAGLDDNRNTFGAFVNQFGDGRPTYSAGMLFEVPVGRRAGKARLDRSRWELAQAVSDFQQAAESAFTEIEVAVRATVTAFNEIQAKRLAVQAAEAEVSYLRQRWIELPDPNESPVVLIDNLLSAQQRLAEEERTLVEAQVDNAMAWVRLRQTTGTLLQTHLLSDVNSGEPKLSGDSNIVDSVELTPLSAEVALP